MLAGWGVFGCAPTDEEEGADGTGGEEVDAGGDPGFTADGGQSTESDAGADGDESTGTDNGDSGPGNTGTDSTGSTGTDDGDADDGSTGTDDGDTDDGSTGTDDGDTDDGSTGTDDGDTDDGSTGTDDGGTGSSDLRLDHMQVKGTHNSYHVKPAVVFHASHDYTHASLDVQLEEQGVRAFELDLHLEADGFRVYHIAVIDAESTCDRLSDCLSLLQGWSEQHRDHVPIMVWFELKDENGGMAIEDLTPIDDLLREMFPEERLFTPDDLAGPHDSPRARIEAEGWPTVDSLRGQFLFVVLNAGGAAEGYSNGYTSLAGRAMFVRASPGQFEDSWAVFSKIDDPASADIADAHASQLIVASNTCLADASDEACEAKFQAAVQSGTQMVMDDFPAPVDGRTYWLDFTDGQPVRCNDVTAPPDCTAADLESL